MTHLAGGNPFCTRFFQPGAIPFYFPPPMSLDELVSGIAHGTGPRWAIVGPHGSGKSTLLHHIAQHPKLSEEWPSRFLIDFHAGETRWSHWRTMHRALGWCGCASRSLLMVDGWEQLDRPLQCYVRWRAAARRAKVLATAHALPARFHALWRTNVDNSVEQHVLSSMLGNDRTGLVMEVMESRDWERSRRRHGPNLRESLFDMYDWYRDQVDANRSAG